MSCGKLPPVGDKGRRYEIRYIERDSHADKRFGWSSEPDKLAEVASLMPSAESVYVLDRESNHKWIRTRLSSGIPFCQTCGIVRRHDGQNKPCKGPTRMREMERIG